MFGILDKIFRKFALNSGQFLRIFYETCAKYIMFESSIFVGN